MCRPNKALHLKEYKGQNVVLGLIIRAISFLRKKRGEKGGKARVWQEIKFWLAFLPISCSYETKQHTRGDLKR